MRWLFGTGLLMIVSLGTAAPAPEATIQFIDLQPKSNHKLKEAMHDANLSENNLADLSPGKQTLDGIKFNIGEGLVQLTNDALKDKFPEKVEGIKVGAKFAKLH